MRKVFAESINFFKLFSPAAVTFQNHVFRCLPRRFAKAGRCFHLWYSFFVQKVDKINFSVRNWMIRAFFVFAKSACIFSRFLLSAAFCADVAFDIWAWYAVHELFQSFMNLVRSDRNWLIQCARAWPASWMFIFAVFFQEAVKGGLRTIFGFENKFLIQTCFCRSGVAFWARSLFALFLSFCIILAHSLFINFVCFARRRNLAFVCSWSRWILIEATYASASRTGLMGPVFYDDFAMPSFQYRK